jgi:hypothetical protein
MANTKKTVLAVLGAILLIVIILIVSAIGGLAYFVRTHMHAQQTTSETAREELDQVRARFAGQSPMIERRSGADEDDDDRFVVHRPAETAPRADLQSLRAIAYDPREHRMMHISVPFWLLRLAPGKGFNSIGTSRLELERSRVTIDDLERHGPGLILDTHDRRGSEVIVWVE